MGLGTGQDLGVNGSHLGRIAEVQPNEPASVLCRISGESLESHRKPDLLGGLGGLLRGWATSGSRALATPQAANRCLPRSPRESAALGQGLGDGRILRSRARRAAAMPIGQAPLPPFVIVEKGTAGLGRASPACRRSVSARCCNFARAVVSSRLAAQKYSHPSRIDHAG